MNIDFNLQYHENEGFFQTVEFDGNVISFSVDGLLAVDVERANAEVKRVWELVLNNLENIKCFISRTIWNKYKSLCDIVESQHKLMKNLPMLSSINIDFGSVVEIVFDDIKLDEIFDGSCYEIVVHADCDGCMNNVFLHKYS